MEVDENLMDICENNVTSDVVEEEKVSDIVRFQNSFFKQG